MRRAPILAIVLSCAAGSALAAPQGSPLVPTAQALAEAAFAPGAAPADNDPIGRLLDHNSAWAIGSPAADTMRVSIGRFSFGAAGVAVDVEPHAGLGFDSYGESSAEAGATVQLSRADLAGERLKAMGVRDGARFGDRGRWYLFAAASGRAVGLNMLHGDQGWNRAGWTTDATSSLTGDAQLGVGWRKGDMQTSFGYIHREVKGQNMLWGVDPKSDSMVAFSLSIRPHR